MVSMVKQVVIATEVGSDEYLIAAFEREEHAWKTIGDGRFSRNYNVVFSFSDNNSESRSIHRAREFDLVASPFFFCDRDF